MDGSASPLLDLFRRGEVPLDVRQMAAQGILLPDAAEQLALLVLLTRDADAGVRATANDTLNRIPADLLAPFLGQASVPEEIREFFAARGVEALVSDGPVPALPVGSPATTDQAAEDSDAGPAASDADPNDGARLATIQRLQQLDVTGKIKAAMRGSREERGILIRDPNKLVSLAVLSSPKLTEQEVESYVRMGSVSEDVLRAVGTNRSWIKNYSIVRGLMFNPKTPVALSLAQLKRLVERDIKAILIDRNIPEPVRMAARKMAQNSQSRRD